LLLSKLWLKHNRLKDSDAEKVKLSQALKTTQAAYTVTRDNLASKSKELDDVEIREQEANCMRRCAYKKHKLDAEGPPIGSPLLFVCDATHVKSIS
jgi:hypothetical protein